MTGCIYRKERGKDGAENNPRIEEGALESLASSFTKSHLHRHHFSAARCTMAAGRERKAVDTCLIYVLFIPSLLFYSF